MPPKNVSPKRTQFAANNFSASAAADISATSVEETTRRFNILKEEVPELGGKVLWQMASSSTPDAMLLNTAVRAIDLATVKRGIENLKDESMETQKVKWQNMSPAKQQIYLDNGYSVPKESSPWWKSALGTAFTPIKAVASGIGKAWDVTGLDSTVGRVVGGIGTGIGAAFNAMTWASDQTINRPFRAMVDTTGQNQEARLDLTFEQARQNLEKQGLNLTNGEWEYLKWKYVEVNGFQRTYYGREGDDAGGAMVGRMMASGNPGGGAALQVFDAITSINQVGDVVKDIPLVGKLVKDPKTENPYDSKDRASGATVDDSVFERFNNEIKKLEENEEYNLSPWSSWNRATDGAHFINPVRQVEAIDRLRAAGLDSDSFDYALYRAKGRSADEWLQEIEGLTPDTPQFTARRQFLSQYEGNNEFKEVLGDLKASGSRYSIGRGYAHAFGLPEDSALFTAVSGAADAAVVMTLDPTLVLGKANKVWRVLRKGIQLADIGRVRWFAKGLREGGNVLDNAIISGIDDIARVNEAVSKIDSSLPNLERVFSRSSLDNLEPLIDENGVITDFAIDNFDEINSLLDDAQKSLINQRNNLGDFLDNEVTDATFGVVRDIDPKNFDEINETMQAIDIAKQLMLRIPPHDASLKKVGRTLSHVRVRQAEKYNRFVETVNDGFKKIKSAADEKTRHLAVNDLRRSIKNGNALVDELIAYDKALIQKGFAGLDDYDSMWDFIEANKTLWGAGTGTSQAVRGFGNGTKIQDSWRLFSNGVESAVFDRNAYVMLPELSKPGVFLRKAAVKSEIVLDEIKRLKDLRATTDLDISEALNFAIRIGSKPLRMTGALLWNLTHHVPKTNGFMSLTGKDAVAEFEKLLNYGVFAGMSRKDRDIFMGKFILGVGENEVSRWIYNGSAADAKRAAMLWDEAIGAKGNPELVRRIREFQGLVFDPDAGPLTGPKLQEIFNPETGLLTKYGEENFDEIKALVWEQFADDLDNPILDIFKKQMKAEARSSTLASRFMVERLFLDDLFTRTGMRETQAGRDVVDKFLNQIFTSRYAPNDIDLVGVGADAQRIPVLPTVQYDEMLSFPDFTKDIQKHATQLGLLSRTIRRSFNSNLVETVMGTYWKPVTLLRLGFVPRAAGEEFLAFYARAGIWAPLSFMATQAAADRRGLVGALSTLPGRLSAKKFGELSRAGLDEDMWRISAMVPYANVSDYIADVAEKVVKRTGQQLNRYDYFALYSSYWTGTVARNIKQLQFRMLPETLQAAAVRSMTDKNKKWVENGLVTMNGISDMVQEAARAAIRDPLHQRAIASAHIESGRTVVPDPADDAIPQTELTVRPNRYGQAEEKVIVQLGHEHEAIDVINDATYTEIAYTYSMAGEENILQPVYEAMGGTITPSTAEGAIAPLLRGTQWEVPTTVVEPEMLGGELVADDVLDGADIADPRNLNVGSADPEQPDLIDRYVEILRQRADALPERQIADVDVDTGLLPREKVEFTTDGQITYDEFVARQPDDVEEIARSLRDPETVALEDGMEVSDSGASYSLDELEAIYRPTPDEAPNVDALDEAVSELSDQELFYHISRFDNDYELIEAGIKSGGSDFGNDFENAVRTEWDKRVEAKKFTAKNIEDSFAAIRTKYDDFNPVVSNPESYSYTGSRENNKAARLEFAEKQARRKRIKEIESLSDRDLMRVHAESIARKETRELTNPEFAFPDWESEAIENAWRKRVTERGFTENQIRAQLDELAANGQLGNVPYDSESLYQLIIGDMPVELRKMPYNIPSSAINRASVVDDLRRLAQRRSTVERSIWFNDDVLGASEEADTLRGLAQIIFDRQFVETEITAARSARTAVSTEDVVASANRFRNRVLNLRGKDKSDLRNWVQGGDRVPNGSAGLPDFEKLGINPNDPRITPAIKAELERTIEGSAFERLVVRALQRSRRGDDELLNILDVLTRTNSARYRQILVSDTAISIGTKEELLAKIKPIIISQLQDPNYAKQIRGSRRYLLNSTSARSAQIPSFENQNQIFFVMVDASMGQDVADSLAKLTDDELWSLLAAASGPDQELSPEVFDSIKQVILNFDSVQTRSVGEARTALSEGELIPISSVGFLDYEHALRVKEAFQNINYNKLLGNRAFNVDSSGEVVEFFPPTFRLGSTTSMKANKDIVRMPNAPYAHRALDDGLLYKARAINDGNVTRYDDGGFLDDFGNKILFDNETIDSNIEAWADVLTRFISETFFSRYGEVLDEVVQPILRGTMSVNAVSTIPLTDLPMTLYRPKKFVPPKENFVQRATRRGFGEIINPAIFALVRHPMYLLSFANGYEFARANNAIFRNGALDKFASEWSALKGVDLEELKNLWAMIPVERSERLDNLQGFVEELENIYATGKINPESPILDVASVFNPTKLTDGEKQDVLEIIKWLQMDSNVEAINVRVAMDRAVNEMIPYIDDHQVRSFFQEYARNIMPFEFAQEQFLKRWARTVAYSPETFRRLQLLAHAFTNNGFVEEQNGQKYFVIPGTESLNELLGKVPVFKHLFGGNVNMPVSIPMGLNTRNVLPGIPSDLENLPSFSPFAMVGIEQLAAHFPEIKKVAQEFNGGRPIDSNQSFADTLLDFVPANYQRLYAGLIGGYSNSPKGMEAELSRNAIAAIQQAEAEAARLRIEQQQLVMLGKMEEAADMQERINQLAPPPDASPEQVEKYLDTIKDWTRANMFVRGALGFITPTTAVNLFEGKELANEFGVLLGQMDFDQALAVFLSEHPDGAAYTVFSTSKSSKAPLPRTEQAINWIQENDGWMKSYSMAAPWLVPQSDSNDDFSQQAYTDMLGAGLRNIKDVDTWYGDFKFASGANIYFPTKLKYDVAKSQTSNAAQRAQLEAQWQAESAVIKLQNPVFADRLAKMVSTDADRTMAEMKVILSLPESELPEIKHLDGLRAAVAAWDQYSAEYSMLAGKNSKQARAQRASLQAAFISYGDQLLLDAPELRSFWNSIVLPSLDLTTKKAIIEIGGR